MEQLGIWALIKIPFGDEGRLKAQSERWGDGNSGQTIANKICLWLMSEARLPPTHTPLQWERRRHVWFG
jgi:hypothetical protein